MRIEIEKLNKTYGKKTIFQSLSMTIEEGKVVCLYGKSGSGKTTLLNIIGQIETYQSGVIRYQGKRKIKRSEFLRNDVGFIFQDYGLIEDETVLKNLTIVRKIRKMKNRETIISDVFAKLNLDKSLLKHKVYELSGGEQQRVTIAKLILKNPPLILADEPTSALDIENKKIIMDYFMEQAKIGNTVIIASHDSEVIGMSDLAFSVEGR